MSVWGRVVLLTSSSSPSDDRSRGAELLRLLVRTPLVGSLWAMLCILTSYCSAFCQSATFHASQEPKSHHDVDEEVEDGPKQAVVFSFGRYEKSLRSICAEMEVDRRRERLFLLAQARAKSGQDCPSCRALWRSVSTACRIVKKDDKPSQKKSKKPSGEHSEEGAVPVLGDASPPPVPTSPPAARYPSTAVVDATSRLTTLMYDADPARGATYQAVVHLSESLLKSPDLTVAERDYFGIFCSYLLAAWEGRTEELTEEASKGGKSQHNSREAHQVNELFE